MPAPEPRKAPQGPQDAPPRPEGPNAPASAPKAQEGPQEPVKDEDGKPVVAPVTVASSAIPHEEEGSDEPDEPRPDRTVPGGEYQVGDKIVNCNGEVLRDAPKPQRSKK